mgnify:CR=1 FL=1
MNKVVFVKAYFKPVGQYETIQVPTGEKKKGFLGGEKDVMRDEKKWKQTGFSDKEIDGEHLQQDLQEAISKLNADGYEVIAVTEIVSGNYEWKYKEMSRDSNGYVGGGYGYGYGFSYTEGLMIIAKK